ncbi:MAG: CPXCG motif-containing cysteine-rich protein [Gammaproteobacteria bacterium]|nr:CPXCG motif-containing cysteine-rich protein [Gammaproteobacteria bacterium]NND39770.1 CPXCG motif-containing cysteine-rich protein [Pseudomonadales bacterium]NNM10442.1 CPXCG motif-containing cysteine-rich protein [Pseudomonadales bacterium]RZV55559.1 MAG: CPXCG motif-containing cysteine-rich protein [Pseudomonadales bacterium]
MESLTESRIHCPYCGESITVLIEPEDVEQEYIEDCQVCCRPITFKLSASSSGELKVSARSENELG